VTPLYSDPIWIGCGKAVLRAYPERNHKLPPVYQGHLGPGAASVRVMHAVKIAACDREKTPVLGDPEQGVLSLGSVLLMERLKPVEPLGLQPSERCFKPLYGIDACERMGQEHQTPSLVNQADGFAGGRRSRRTGPVLRISLGRAVKERAAAKQAGSAEPVAGRRSPGLAEYAQRLEQGFIVLIEPVTQQMHHSGGGAGIYLQADHRIDSPFFEHGPELGLPGEGVVVGEGSPDCPHPGDRVGDIRG
jgi:hypothetical protein